MGLENDVSCPISFSVISLKNYRYEAHFGSLIELYNRNELTSAINRIIEDINHRFTIEVLTRQFRSTDLRISENNLRSTNDILDRIDKEKVTQRLREILEIKNKEEQTVEITEPCSCRISAV